MDTQGTLSWSLVHDKLGTKTRACAYDRAGLMWSDNRSATADLLGSIATDLHKTLEIANIQPPYILVGHSYGGSYITKYTELYPDSVSGLVFIDSTHPEQMALVKNISVPLLTAIQQWGNKALNPVFSPVFNALGITRILTAFDNNTLPNQTNYDAHAVKAFLPTSNKTLSQDIENYSNGFKQISHYRDFGDRPIYVLANIVNYIKMSDEQLIALGLNRNLVDAVMKQDLYMFNDQASWSSISKLVTLHDFSHYIQFDRPNEVIKAVEWVFKKLKEMEN